MFLEHKYLPNTIIIKTIILNYISLQCCLLIFPRRPKYHATQLNLQGCSQEKGGAA